MGGVVGFVYEAVKDVCKWYGLEKKRYIPFLLSIGIYATQKEDKKEAITADSLEKLIGVKNAS